MLCVSAGNILAFGAVLPNPLYDHAWFTDTWECVEQTGNTTSWDLRMKLGDYIRIFPVHWILTSHLSYTEEGVQISDPSVVGAAFVHDSDGYAEISLHGKREGIADVTVTYKTIPTAAEQGKSDLRDAGAFTRTVHVTVESGDTLDVEASVGGVRPIDLDVSLNISGEGYASVKGITMSMPSMAEPRDLFLALTLSNHSQTAAEGVSLVLKPDRNLSWFSENGPFAAQMFKPVGRLEAGESRIITVPLYPRLTDQTVGGEEEKALAYTAAVRAELSYTDPNFGSRMVSEQLDFSGYTAVTEEELEKYEDRDLQDLRFRAIPEAVGDSDAFDGNGALLVDMKEKPEDALRLECFSRLLVKALESFYGINSEETKERGAVEAALEYGILNEEQEREIGENALTLDQALVMTDQALWIMGVLDPGHVAWDWEHIAKTEAANAGQGAAAQAPAGQGSAFADAGTGWSRKLSLDEGIREGSLSVEDGVLLASRLLDKAEAVAVRDLLLKRLAGASLNNLTWSDDYADAGLFAEDPDQTDGLLYSDMVFWWPAADAGYALHQDLGSMIPVLVENVDDLKGNAGAAEALSAQGYEGVGYDLLGGMCCDEKGRVHRWMPFCYLDSQGKIYEDAVYLYLAVADEGEDSDYISRHHVNSGGTANMTEFLFTDQELVAAFLSESLASKIEYTVDESKLEELKSGRSGDGVKALQQDLMTLGYRTVQADGIYGSSTAAAIRAFQTTRGLQVTGTADPHTRAEILKEVGEGMENPFLGWIERHCPENAHEILRKAVTRNTKLKKTGLEELRKR